MGFFSRFKKENIKETILAIDFGTSNSVAYLLKNGNMIQVNDDSGSGIYSFPSIVAYQDGKVLTCTQAKQGKREGRLKYVVTCVKRAIGLKYEQFLQLPDQNVFGCDVVEGPDNKPRFIVSDDGMQKDCIEVAAEIFATIRKNAVRMCGKKEIDECYVTVPANYQDNQREDIKIAASKAGLTVTGIIPEPTAAAMSWCFNNESKLSTAEKMLVFDFGGGTLDISVIEYDGNGKFHVCVTDGNPRLGGSDVDMEVAKLVVEMAQDQENECFDPLNNRERVRFLGDCEDAKISLSSSDEAILDVTQYDDSMEKEYKVTREQLASIFSKTLKNQIDECLNRILVGPSLARGVIKHVFMVGGSTRLIAVREYMRNMFRCDFPKVNEESCVAEGALNVARINHGTSRQIKEQITYSYGLLSGEDQVVMLLNRGTRIPCDSGRFTFSTSVDYPKTIKSIIYQWNGTKKEQGRVVKPRSECNEIKNYEFENPNPKPKGEQKFDIIFRLAVGGTLEVVCYDHSTNVELNRVAYSALIVNSEN